MSAQKDLKIYCNSDDDIIRDYACKANEYVTLYSEGKLSQDEYLELVDDLLDIKKIEEYKSVVELYNDLLKIYDIIATLRAFSPI